MDRQRDNRQQTIRKAHELIKKIINFAQSYFHIIFLVNTFGNTEGGNKICMFSNDKTTATQFD